MPRHRFSASPQLQHPVYFDENGATRKYEASSEALQQSRQEYFQEIQNMANTGNLNGFGQQHAKMPPPPLQTYNLSAQSSMLHHQFSSPSEFNGVAVPSDEQSRTPVSSVNSPASTIASPFYSNFSATNSMASFSSVTSASTAGGLETISSDDGEASYPSNSMAQQYNVLPDGQVQPFNPDATNEEAPVDMDPLAHFEFSEPKKRGSRRIWTHALEKYLFTPHEMYVIRVYFQNLS